MQDGQGFMNNCATKCHAAIDKGDLFNVCIEMILGKHARREENISCKDISNI